MRRKCDVMGGQHINMQRKNMMNMLDCKSFWTECLEGTHSALIKKNRHNRYRAPYSVSEYENYCSIETDVQMTDFMLTTLEHIYDCVLTGPMLPLQRNKHHTGFTG